MHKHLIKSSDSIFAVELQKSDRMRAFIVAGIVFIIAVLMVFVHALEGHHEMVDHDVWINITHSVSAILFITSAYEIVYGLVITRNIRKNARLPFVMQLTGTFLETSIPSLIILASWQAEGSIDSVFSAVMYLYFIFLTLNAFRLSFILGIIGGAVAAVEYYFLSGYIVSHTADQSFISLMSVPFQSERIAMLILGGIVSGYLGFEIRHRFIKSVQRMESMNRSFARFVPEEFLALLGRKEIMEVRNGDQTLGIMTVMFMDIRGFTSITEHYTPRETIWFLNSFFAEISPIIKAHGGIIDKYIGDAVMAIFDGAADNAIEAASSMRKRVEIMNVARQERGEKELRIGIGIHRGPVVLGTVGDEHRIDTTVISDAVNIASRLEGLCKSENESIIVSRETVSAVENADRFKLRVIGEREIRGRIGKIEVIAVQ